MNQDQFRVNVYEVLKQVKSGEMKISQAQRRIIRSAKRTVFEPVFEGTEGQDRESYSDDQDRENYTV